MMSYKELTQKLKHLPGRHNQRSHAPHGSRAGVAFSKIVERVYLQKHNQGDWISRKRAAELAADEVLEGFRDRQGKLDIEEAKATARDMKGKVAGSTGWGEMFDDITLEHAIANHEARQTKLPKQRPATEVLQESKTDLEDISKLVSKLPKRSKFTGNLAAYGRLIQPIEDRLQQHLHKYNTREFPQLLDELSEHQAQGRHYNKIIDALRSRTEG